MNEVNALNGAVQATGKCVGFFDKFLGTLDKYNLLPMWNFRRQNMLDKQAIELELNEKAEAHKRKLALEDARVRELTTTMEQSSILALDAARRDMENGMDLPKALTKNDPSSVYATSYLYKNALEGQYARERVISYAALNATDDQTTEITADEPSDTWMHHFTKFVSDLRDEDAYKLWGKILAGEIKRPGTFSLRFLNILATLDQRDAKIFKQLAPFVVGNFIPDLIREKIGVNLYAIKTLESLGLFITGVGKPFDGGVFNRYYVAASVEIKSHKRISIPSIILTPVGDELLKLVAISEEEALKGITAFVEFAKSNYNLELQIMKLHMATS